LIINTFLFRFFNCFFRQSSIPICSFFCLRYTSTSNGCQGIAETINCCVLPSSCCVLAFDVCVLRDSCTVLPSSCCVLAFNSCVLPDSYTVLPSSCCVLAFNVWVLPDSYTVFPSSCIVLRDSSKTPSTPFSPLLCVKKNHYSLFENA